MTPNTFVYAGLSSGLTIIMAHLIRQMDSKGLIAKDQFATEIENAILGLPLSEEDGKVRYDRLMIENLVKLLRQPGSGGWTPELIQGGLSDPTDRENSDP